MGVLVLEFMLANVAGTTLSNDQAKRFLLRVKKIEMFMTSAVRPKPMLNMETRIGLLVQKIDNPEASGGVPARNG